MRPDYGIYEEEEQNLAEVGLRARHYCADFHIYNQRRESLPGGTEGQVDAQAIANVERLV